MDAAGARLKKLEAEVLLAKSEVMAIRMRVRAKVAVAKSEMAKAKTKVEESRKERYEVALSDIRATFLELDLLGFGLLKESQVKP